MIVRRVLLPLAVVFALGFVAAGTAQAAPVSAFAPASLSNLHPDVTVGFGVAVPLGRTYRPARPVRVRSTPGYWTTREEHVWVPGELIGYDVYGRPVVTEGHWVVKRTRVWVPGRTYTTYPRHRVRPRGYVRVGLRFR